MRTRWPVHADRDRDGRARGSDDSGNLGAAARPPGTPGLGLRCRGIAGA